jgi:hypothetical protein
MTPFAYATPHSNAPYIERTRSEVGIYEDESGDDEQQQEHGSTTDEIGFDGEETGYEDHALSDYDSDEEGSVELGQERQVDEEWEGVQDEGLPSALRNDNEDGENASEDSVPSEYPSNQQPRQVESPIFSGTKVAFRIHVDEGDDEL